MAKLFNPQRFEFTSSSDSSCIARPIVRPIRNTSELQEVYRLTHDCYVNSGYCKPHPTGMVVHYAPYDHIAETTILVALLDGQIVGSVSITVDGPSGFTVDEDFNDECIAIRQEGKPVAVVWRLVVKKSEQPSRMVVVSLINEVVSRLRRFEINTALFSVNPKHENVYRRLLNMSVVARKSGSNGLENAPAVLLRGDSDKILKNEVVAAAKPITNPIFQFALL
jgi:hypothetical protein